MHVRKELSINSVHQRGDNLMMSNIDKEWKVMSGNDHTQMKTADQKEWYTVGYLLDRIATYCVRHLTAVMPPKCTTLWLSNGYEIYQQHLNAGGQLATFERHMLNIHMYALAILSHWIHYYLSWEFCQKVKLLPTFIHSCHKVCTLFKGKTWLTIIILWL